MPSKEKLIEQLADWIDTRNIAESIVQQVLDDSGELTLETCKQYWLETCKQYWYEACEQGFGI